MYNITQNKKIYPVNLAISVCDNFEIYDKIPGFINEKLPGNMIFFVKPPSEIGNLTNATSSYFTNSRFYKKSERNIIIICSILVGLIFGIFLPFQFDFSNTWKIIFPIISVFVFFITGLVIIGVKNTYSCIYLGEKGLVEYEMRDSKDNITQNILIFDTEMVLEKITLGSHYNWYKNIHNVGLFNDIFTIDGSTKKSDEIAKKAELNWNKFLYENKVIKDIERKGVYEYHSRILFSKKIIVFFDNNDLHVITDTNAQYLSKKEVTIPINSPQYTHATLLHLVLNDIENDKIIPVANLVTEFNSNLILYFVEKQFNKTFNGKKSEPAKIANKVNKESIYKLLPEPIRNCTHSWVMGPEKSCSICGKVQSYPPPHGCQKCGILLCDECYDFASS